MIPQMRRGAAPLDAAAGSDELSSYRAVSPLSVIALMLGLLSFLALVSPLFWILPLTAIVVSVLALRKVDLAGRKAAVCGLLLGVLLGSGAPARAVTRRHLIYRQAREHSQSWLEMVREGDLFAAHQLHLIPELRAPADLPLSEYYASELQAQQRLEEFFAANPLNRLRELKQNGTLHFVANVQQTHHGKEDTVVQHFQVEYEENGQKRTLPLTVYLLRHFEIESGISYWKIDAVVAPPEPGQQS